MIIVWLLRVRPVCSNNKKKIKQNKTLYQLLLGVEKKSFSYLPLEIHGFRQLW